MKTIMALGLCLGALSITGPAQAQQWGGWNGGGGWGWQQPQQGYGYRGGWDDGRARYGAVCSGNRAQGLEARLNHEREEGDIDPWTADRIHTEIDKLERKQDHECDEGDWGAVNKIAGKYDRIEGWIQSEAGRSHWRGW